MVGKSIDEKNPKQGIWVPEPGRGWTPPPDTKEEESRSISLQHAAEVCLNGMNKNKFIKIINWKSNFLPPRSYKGRFQQNSSTFLNQRMGKHRTAREQEVGQINKQKIHELSPTPVTCTYLAQNLSILWTFTLMLTSKDTDITCLILWITWWQFTTKSPHKSALLEWKVQSKCSQHSHAHFPLLLNLVKIWWHTGWITLEQSLSRYWGTLRHCTCECQLFK